MAQDGGQGLDIHAVAQGVGGEGMAQIMEADVLASGVFQDQSQPFADGVGIQRGVFLYMDFTNPPFWILHDRSKMALQTEREVIL